MVKSAPAPLYLEITAVLRGEEAAQKIERGEISRRTGIPVRTLHTYLTDQREMKVGQIDALAKALGFKGATEVMILAEQRLQQS
jgi:hypothetical protein